MFEIKCRNSIWMLCSSNSSIWFISIASLDYRFFWNLPFWYCWLCIYMSTFQRLLFIPMENVIVSVRLYGLDYILSFVLYFFITFTSCIMNIIIGMFSYLFPSSISCLLKPLSTILIVMIMQSLISHYFLRNIALV